VYQDTSRSAGRISDYQYIRTPSACHRQVWGNLCNPWLKICVICGYIFDITIRGDIAKKKMPMEEPAQIEFVPTIFAFLIFDF